MSKYDYSEYEQQLNNVLAYQSKELSGIKRPSMNDVNERIEESESLLQELGYGIQLSEIKQSHLKDLDNNPKSVIIVPSWQDLCLEAEKCVGTGNELEDIFTPEELKDNELAVLQLKEDYDSLNKLDKNDIAIGVTAGLLGAAVDILLVGIPKRTPEGLKGGTLANYVRNWFEKKYPPEEMERLANSSVSKVPYDAQDNRNTEYNVEGLSAYYHRLLSLGHDPFLGLLFGVLDIVNGTMTTIDKRGKVLSQLMQNYEDRKEQGVFAAIAKQIMHFKSDITTSMGLPAPLMGLFNILQFGNIGDEDQTIAEIVQGMYYEGYDFIHFCTLSIPVMITEVVIRTFYGIKRIKEGYSVKDSIPISLNRDKHPKLGTMLFIGHSAATAINAGKVFFTKNPMAINYPQWIAFAKYSFQQLKWILFDKPNARDKYIKGVLYEELEDVYKMVDSSFEDLTRKYIVVFE